MSDFSGLLDLFNNEEANHGLTSSGALPRGKYPVKIRKISEQGTSKNTGTPYANLQLEVLEGPYVKRVAFVTVWLSNCARPDIKALIDAGQGDGASEPARKARQFFNGTKTLLKVLGVQPNLNVAPTLSDGEKSLAFWAPERWEGKAFIAGIGVDTAENQIKSATERGAQIPADPSDRNTLSNWNEATPDTLDEWRKKELPKQIAAKAAEQSGQTASTNTATKF